MNQEWSELNNLMQKKIGKKDTFSDGIKTLLQLRKSLMNQILELQMQLTKEQLCAIPFINAKGYQCKTIAYSIWHIMRIEDIVTNTLIRKEEEIFFKEGFKERIGSPILTTGNELVKQEITDFSKQLDMDVLFEYAKETYRTTNAMLTQLTFTDLKTGFTEEDKERIRKLHVVNECEDAAWLIDYWCSKNVKGLLQMPFSRHWIMHVGASLRIRDKIMK